MGDYYFYTEKLCVGYGRKPLIRDMKIFLPKGEILCLIGPNGSGKSTVLKSIARQLEFLGGTAYLGKENLAVIRNEELAKKMAVMFTEKMKAEMMDCQAMVATGRYPYTGRFGILSKEDERIVSEAMRMVHITEIGRQDFNKISDGQKQRVMLARAICQEPEILILDEPTSYLDIKYKLEFLSILQKLRKRKGITVIMSLHELELAKRVSDKILCLKGEYVEQYGTPEEVFKPGFIEKLFGITPGRFDQESGTLELERPKGKAELFVMGGGGMGRSVYHKLQRKGKAFATGIIYDNDLDYPTANALALEVICAKAFEPVETEILEQAKKTVDLCKEVICCRQSIGSLDEANRELLSYAREKGKSVICLK